MNIDDKMLKYIFELAKLELDEEKKESLKNDLEKIIDYMEILKQADTEGVVPMSHTFMDTDVFRDDVIKKPMKNEDILSNAPETKDGYFVAPKTIE